ncbi:hypothetical protein V495_03870 [Pseudogymnoascus sp. VKM F-4514 (FW-929)]|nr:hypothetical protein V495_03870 [Pseudogymnoascus sp. VKM F-4514 (FW-929)]
MGSRDAPITNTTKNTQSSFQLPQDRGPRQRKVLACEASGNAGKGRNADTTVELRKHADAGPGSHWERATGARTQGEHLA